MQTKKFQKRVEDFVCEKCSHKNIGDGFTNHCHKCLWSKHVDENPGDRLLADGNPNACGGLMEPIGLLKRGDTFFIVHKCQKCGVIRKNRAQVGDDFSELVRLSRGDRN